MELDTLSLNIFKKFEYLLLSYYKIIAFLYLYM